MTKFSVLLEQISFCSVEQRYGMPSCCQSLTNVEQAEFLSASPRGGLIFQNYDVHLFACGSPASIYLMYAQQCNFHPKQALTLLEPLSWLDKQRE